MSYDFDQYIERRDTDSVKWNPIALKEQFGEGDLLPLWVADMDFYPPKEIGEAIQKRLDHGLFGYTFRTEACDEAIIDWYKRRWHAEIKREWISVTSGAVQAITQLIQEFTDEGDGVLIQPPVYYPFRNSIEENHRKVVENPIKVTADKVTIDFEQLEEIIVKEDVKMMVLSNPHNPLSKVWTKEELNQLAEILTKHQVFLISDELHGDLVFEPHKHNSFLNCEAMAKDLLVVITSPSKTFNLPGLAFTVVIIQDEKIKERFDARLNMSKIHANHPLTLAGVEAAYRHGDDWLDHVLTYIYDNYLYLKEQIEKELPEAFVLPLEGTYLAWVNVESYVDDKSLEEPLVNKGKLAVDDGIWFGDEGAYSARFNLACPRKIVEDAVERFVRVIK